MPDLNLKEMQKLASSENSCIVKKEKKILLLIQPRYTNNLKQGIKVAMDNLTIGFSQYLGGLMLGYENVKVHPGSGQIHSTNYLIHLHVRATCYIFAPTKGLLIEGIVNKVTPHMVSFLAYNKYNIIYHVHQVRQELRQQAENSNNSEAAVRSTKLVLQHLQDLSLFEGMSCTLLLQEVALRDFLPSLRGYPVPAGLDVSSLSDVSVIPAAADSRRKRVRFSDEESVCSSDPQSSEQSLPPLTQGSERGEVALAALNGDLKKTRDSDSSYEPVQAKTKNLKKKVKPKVECPSAEKSLVPDVVVKEEVLSPNRIPSDGPPVQPTSTGSESSKKKKQKWKSKSKDNNYGSAITQAELAAVIESSRLCHAGGNDDEHGFAMSALDIKNSDLAQSSPAKKKRKRDENNEDNFLQKASKKAKKK